MNSKCLWFLILLILCVGTISEWWFFRWDVRDPGFRLIILIFGVFLMMSFFYWLAGLEIKRIKNLGS